MLGNAGTANECPAQQAQAQIIDAAAAGDPAPALDNANTLLAKGVSPDQAFEALLERLRDLMVICACGPATDLVELSDDVRAE